MNSHFASFIAHARLLADRHRLMWDVPMEADGNIAKRDAWDLCGLVGAPPPRALIAHLGLHPKALGLLNRRRELAGQAENPPMQLQPHWRDLIKAAALDQVLVRKNQPSPVNNNVVRPLRIIATCSNDIDPWDITIDRLALAFAIASEMAESGQYAAMIISVTREVFDKFTLADRSPLAGLLGSSTTASVPKAAADKALAKRDFRKTEIQRKSLNDRKSAEKLPEHRAFWELIRIVFTEHPKTFTDAIRFTQLKLLILCGFRIGEVSTIPFDWRRTREYVDYNGRPAGEVGGISRSLMIRHFAEKQRGADENSVELYEAAQHVPPLFEQIIEESLAEVERLTAPLRARLKLQTETGLLFPELDGKYCSAVEMYPRTNGSPEILQGFVPDSVLNGYRQTLDISILDDLYARQMADIDTPLAVMSRQYWSKLHGRLAVPLVEIGNRIHVPWRRVLFDRMAFEQYVRHMMPTKLPDISPLPLADGKKLFPHELLFLVPKRPLIEERNDGVCDVGRYFGVGYSDTHDLMNQLGNKESTLFRRYGQTDEDRALELNTHALRHLQNTELFRLGVADTIITKRYNRRSVAQSYVYDHRSLAEDLDAIDLPPGAEDLGEKALQAFRMMKGGKITGRLVDEFKAIQRKDGEDAAFAFLSAEASGFHTTPYGYCINSFTVDPCPKHLECFAGCSHFGVSELEEHRTNLRRTGDQLRKTIGEIESLPPTSIGRDNQLAHAKVRLKNIETMLATAPGVKPFPDGPDLSVPAGQVEHRSVLDD